MGFPMLGADAGSGEHPCSPPGWGTEPVPAMGLLHPQVLVSALLCENCLGRLVQAVFSEWI